MLANPVNKENLNEQLAENVGPDLNQIALR